MNLRDRHKGRRARWAIIFWTTVIMVAAAVAINMTTTPLYVASTRLFVSTAADSAANIYEGSRDRVNTYAKLLTGRTLAQRTVDKLGLTTSAQDLQRQVSAHADRDTVLLEVNVLDQSPSRARDIANALSDEFVKMMRELETPADGDLPNARVSVQERAIIPTTPAIPRRTRNIAIGLGAGLLLGIAFAAIRDWRNRTPKNSDPISAAAPQN